jgi:conjugative transfer signal peptidase TraF
LVVIALITSFILFGHRLIVNRTHSLPVGLYYWTDMPIKKGSIVLFKPDQSTPLQQLGINRGYEARKLPLLKRVVALAGDVVSVSSSGVSINGQPLPNSAPLFDDEAGRPLTMAQLYHFRLGTDQAFLMGVTPTSWDSRYFGPVPLSRCSGSFVPVLNILAVHVFYLLPETPAVAKEKSEPVFQVTGSRGFTSCRRFAP